MLLVLLNVRNTTSVLRDQLIKIPPFLTVSRQCEPRTIKDDVSLETYNESPDLHAVEHSEGQGPRGKVA